MNKEAFVYRWVNLTNGKYYIGYHKGSLDDGYISSSHSKLFWDDFNNSEMIWEREILFIGSKNDCLFEEQKILKELDLKDSKVYNNARGSQIIFTDEIISKMSDSGKKRWKNMSEESKKEWGERVSKSKIGVKRPAIASEKSSKLFKGKSYIERYGEEKSKEISKKISESNKGQHYHSEEHKKKLSLKLMGNNYGKYQSEETREKKRIRMQELNLGKTFSDETRKKISESKKGIPSLTKGVPRKKVTCPYCNKEGGEGLMHRWHFENCKNK